MAFLQRSDNSMRNMAHEVNMVESDRKCEAGKPMSEKQKKVGKNIFGIILGLLFVLVIIAVFRFLKRDTQQEEYYYAVINEDEISGDYSVYLLDSQHLENNMVVYGIGYDSNSKKYSGNIFGYSHETKEKNMLAMNNIENKQIQEFRIANKKIYILTLDENSIWGIQAYDQNGDFLQKFDMGDCKDATEIRFWDVDAEENLIAVDESNQLKVIEGENGQKKYSTSIKENLCAAFVSEDNKLVYLSIDNQGDKKISVIDYLNQTEAEEVLNGQDIADDILGIYSGGRDKILVSGNMALYELDIKKNKINQIFDWLEVDVDNTNIATIIKEDEIYYIYNVKTENNVKKLETIQIGKRYGENPIKVVNIASISVNQDIKKIVVDFNKNHSDIKARLITYGSEENYEVRFTRMLNELNSNKEIDIIVTDSTHFEMLAEKELLQELDTYIQENELEDKLVSSVLNAYKVDGKTYVMMDRFGVYTVLGRKSIFEEDRAYTVGEILNIAKNNDNTLYCENVQADVLFNFFVLNDEKENFQKILDNEIEDVILCAQTAPGEYVSYDKDALMEEVGLGQSFYKWFALFRAGHDEEFSIVGYPCGEQGGSGAMSDCWRMKNRKKFRRIFL